MRFFFYLNLCPSVKLESISCLFIPIFCPTNGLYLVETLPDIVYIVGSLLELWNTEEQ